MTRRRARAVSCTRRSSFARNGAHLVEQTQRIQRINLRNLPRAETPDNSLGVGRWASLRVVHSNWSPTRDTPPRERATEVARSVQHRRHQEAVKAKEGEKALTSHSLARLVHGPTGGNEPNKESGATCAFARAVATSHVLSLCGLCCARKAGGPEDGRE